MLYGLLLTSYLFICILLILLILIQKGKEGTGFGALTSSSQMFFGGSGGQDIFQKTTWVLGALFMFGSFSLSIIKTKQSHALSYTKTIHKPVTTSESQQASDTKE